MFGVYDIFVFGDPDPIKVGSWYFTEGLSCSDSEEYLQTPLVNGFAKWENGYSHEKYNKTVTGFTPSGSGRYAAYIYTPGYGSQLINFTDAGTIRTDSGNYSVAPPWDLNNNTIDYSGNFETNIPVFANGTDAYDYTHAATDTEAKQILQEKALNYGGVPVSEPDTEDHYIFNTYDTCTINKGIVTYTGGDPTGRFEIFKCNGGAALYYVDKNNSLELSLIAEDVVGSVYSSINKQDVLNKQFNASEWYNNLHYSGPFYNTLEYLPDGSYTIGVSIDTDLPIFGSYADALDYLSGNKPIEDAENYGKIGRPDIAENETGTKELITTFGGNLSENVFSHDYLMTRTQLADVGGKFFDTNIITALLDGLKLYGNNPMDSVLSCLYFPFDLSSVCTSSPVTSIYFGSYEMEDVSANKVSTRSGYKELGSTFIKPTFYNWLDYEAMHIYLYLPYIGFVELDVSKYLNKWLKIVYMVDLHSGECEVSLCADGLLMDTYSGQIGIKQPITYNDLATYFQSQITALRNGVMSSVGLPIAGTATGAGIGAQTGNPYGAAAGAIAGAAITAPFVAPNAIYQGVKVANSKPPLFSKGGYSSEIGANMPQYAFLVFMYNDIQEPDNLVDIFGKPSNESGTVGSFNGFLSVSSVNLQCSGATDAEKAEIISLLHNGIYI